MTLLKKGPKKGICSKKFSTRLRLSHARTAGRTDCRPDSHTLKAQRQGFYISDDECSAHNMCFYNWDASGHATTWERIKNLYLQKYSRGIFISSFHAFTLWYIVILASRYSFQEGTLFAPLSVSCFSCYIHNVCDFPSLREYNVCDIRDIYER